MESKIQEACQGVLQRPALLLHQGEEETRAGGNGAPARASISPTRSSDAGWLFSAVLRWDKKTMPSQPHTNRSSDTGCLPERDHVRKVTVVGTFEDCQLAALLEARIDPSVLKESLGASHSYSNTVLTALCFLIMTMQLILQ